MLYEASKGARVRVGVLTESVIVRGIIRTFAIQFAGAFTVRAFAQDELIKAASFLGLEGDVASSLDIRLQRVTESLDQVSPSP